MEMFWICTDCGSANPYPNMQECDVCGKPISEDEAKKAQMNYRAALKSEEKEKEEQRKAELQRLRAEEEARQRAQYEAEQARLRKEREEKARLAREKEAARISKFTHAYGITENFISGYSKFMLGLKKALKICMFVSIAVAAVSIIINGKLESTAEYITESFAYKADAFIGNNFEPFTPLVNIKQRIVEIWEHIQTSENINMIFDFLGW